MGRKQAVGLVAAKTTAADVECLRSIREKKLFRAKGVDWTEFCQQYAGVTRSYADRLIRHLEDFGPNYFHLSQIVRISSEDYRKIAPAVSDEGIEFGEEKIAISPENSQKLVEAVNELRAAIPAKEVETGIGPARRRLQAGIAALNQAVKSGLSDEERAELAQTVSDSLTDLNLLWIALR
jgi:predicted GIY-YIG superfamily endonuclease